MDLVWIVLNSEGCCWSYYWCFLQVWVIGVWFLL